MFFITILLLGLLAFISSFNYLKEYFRYRKLISKLPGPKTYSILGNVPDLLCDEDTLFKRVRQWSQEYFPVYRLSLGTYHTANIASPEDFEAIASTSKNITKNVFYKFIRLWIGEGLLVSTGSKWHARRKILTPAFHFNILQQFLETFINQTDHLVNKLKETSDNTYLNMLPYTGEFALRVINETSMGVKLNLEKKEVKSYCVATNEIGKIVIHRLTRPWLYFNSIFYNFMRLGHKERRWVNIAHKFTGKVITDRERNFETFEMPKDENDTFNNFKRKRNLVLIDILLNAKIGSGTIDDKGIHEEVNTFMFTGYDTSATAIAFILMVLAQHRDAQDLILEEINKVLVDPKAKPTYNDMQELKYMERCIKECLRLFPPAPLIGRVLEEDVKTSHGYILPRGTPVQIHIFDIHRNPKIWPNPEKFDPDRFLPENCQGRHRFAFVPFSAGPRNCIGQKYAMLEVKVCLWGILKNFVLEPVDTPEDIVLLSNVLLTPKDHSVRVKLIPRENN